MSIRGRVTVASTGTAPIIVAALEVPTLAGMPFRIADYVVLEPNGGVYSFALPPMTYRVAAFEDGNRDLDYQPNERAGAFDDFHDLALSPGEIREHIDIHIAASDPRGQELALEHPTGETRSLHIGDVVPLEDPRFAHDTGRMGMLEPLRFTREIGNGVLLTEEHRHERIPILFVHGISGYPQEFREIIASLDRSRYEAWIVQYASGFDLSLIAEYVDRALDEIELAHRLDTLCVVAHSMGGVVMREALSRHARSAEHARVPLFITIASPLGGHPGAAAGVAFSPVVLPVWQSLVPSGPFIRALFDAPLAPETRYELIFAYGSSDNSDGVVPLQSQLREEAQREAALVRGFYESHTGVLHSEAAVHFIAREINAHCQR